MSRPARVARRGRLQRERSLEHPALRVHDGEPGEEALECDALAQSHHGYAVGGCLVADALVQRGAERLGVAYFMRLGFL